MDADGGASVKGPRIAGRVRDGSEGGEDCIHTGIVHRVLTNGRQCEAGASAIRVLETSQMDALGPCEIDISGPTGSEFLFVLPVYRIDSRVRVVFAKNRDSGLGGGGARGE